MIIDIPHKLERDEVKRRLQSRIGELPEHIPGGIAEVSSSWPAPDRMAIAVGALGQQVTGTIDVHEQFVRLTVVLPAALSFMGPLIEAAIRQKGEKLLLEDGRG